MNRLDILKQAREYLSDHTRFAQKNFFYDKNNEPIDLDEVVQDVPRYLPEIASCCSMGAVALALFKNDSYELVGFQEIWRFMDETSKKVTAQHFIIGVNDHVGYEAVLKVLDKAIEELENEKGMG